MAVYMIHAPNKNDESHTVLGADTARRVTAVKQGFHWLAFFFSLIWLLVNRLWLWAFVFFAASIVVMLAGHALGAAPVFVSTAMMVLSGFIGFEAANLRSAALKKRGLDPAGAMIARSKDEAVLRFFEKTT